MTEYEKVVSDLRIAARWIKDDGMPILAARMVEAADMIERLSKGGTNENGS